MLNDEVRRVLDGSPIAHLASTLPDGSPHSIPLWIGTVGDLVAFLTGPDSRKAQSAPRPAGGDLPHPARRTVPASHPPRAGRAMARRRGGMERH
jgi:pyridoxamine 5'-phosphate oxidase-like protein